MDKKIILASGSPRRIEMMKEHGYDPIVMPADIEENIPQHSSMTDTVMFLSLKKAQWVQDKIKEEDPELYAKCPVIIASDTIVYKDEIMGKPKDYEDGFKMLSALRGDFHYVVSGVAIIKVEPPKAFTLDGDSNVPLDPLAGYTQRTEVFYDITKVYFKDYSDEELDAYLKTDEAYDKAGGYAIQGTFAKYIDHYEGSLTNVIGFPWEKFEEKFAALI